MDKKIENFITIEKNSVSAGKENNTVEFAEPLAITDDSRQWNMTCYDINTLDISDYDGVVTANHGQEISDVIGKVVNLRKDGNKVLIDGIKFAVNENPLAVLAKNLMLGGFVSGVSIETIGGDPDNDGVWHNHRLCGLSVVAHPNNLNAYAVISNSIDEAKQYGLKTDKLEKLVENKNDVMKVVKNNSTRLDKIINSYVIE